MSRRPQDTIGSADRADAKPAVAVKSRRSFGSVREKPKGSGKWEARYRDHRGQMHYRYFTTKAEATAHLSVVQADMLRGDWLDPGLGRITVAEFSNTWLLAKTELRPRTDELYRYLLRCHVLPTFGTWSLASVTPEDVYAWKRSLRDNPMIGSSTENRAFRVLVGIFKLAVQNRRIAYNPCDGIRAPQDDAGEMLVITPAQVADLAEAIGHDHRQYRALVLLAAYGGLRWGECVGLGVQNVDPLRGTVKVERQLHPDGRMDEPKSKKGRRTVRLPRWLTDELAHTIATRRPADDLPERYADLVFLTPSGRPMAHNSNFRRRTWRPAVVAALPPHLHGLRFHDLRHTAVAIAIESARLAAQPLNAKALQERMGHSTIRLTLDRYGHLLEGHDDDMVAGMADPFIDRVAASGLTSSRR